MPRSSETVAALASALAKAQAELINPEKSLTASRRVPPLPASALICREFHDRIVAALAAALERSYEKLSYRSNDPITPSIRSIASSLYAQPAAVIDPVEQDGFPARFEVCVHGQPLALVVPVIVDDKNTGADQARI
jgi:hypothetical protein